MLSRPEHEYTIVTPFGGQPFEEPREFGKPGWPHVDPEIASLDDREQQSLIVEIKAHHDR